jgi:hypothetical protein
MFRKNGTTKLLRRLFKVAARLSWLVGAGRCEVVDEARFVQHTLEVLKFAGQLFQLAEAASKYQVRNSVSCGLKFRPCSVTIRELLQVEKAVIPLVHICP